MDVLAGWDDEELASLALAAEPGLGPAPDAVPIDVYLAARGVAPPPGEGLLPGWYMAPPVGRAGSRWYRAVVLAVIGAFLLIEAFGLCSTYGQPPWH